jgi:hypothetical protein
LQKEKETFKIMFTTTLERFPMDSIVPQLMTILKADESILEREAKIRQIFTRSFGVLLSEAFERLDKEVIQPYLSENFKIEKRSKRAVTFPLGTVTYFRRRLTKPGEKAVYPLDSLLGLQPRQQFSCGTESLLSEVSTLGVYRKSAEAIRIVSPLSISHQKLRDMAVKVGKEIDEAQTADLSRHLEPEIKKKVKVLYVEGDAFCVHGKNRELLYFHRLQVCESREKTSKKRKSLIGFHEFIDFDHKKVYSQMLEYLSRTYEMSEVTLVTNSDGGSGYAAGNFKFLLSDSRQNHEHFIDRYHVNQKLKQRLKLFPSEMIDRFKQVLLDYDKAQLEVLYDTTLSLCETDEQEEELEYLRKYITRNRLYLKPFEKRPSLEDFERVLGTCESNHRLYTYRMKKQGKYWSREGALAMAKLISAKRNGELWKYGAGYIMPLEGQYEDDFILSEIPGSVVRGLKRLWDAETDYEDLHQAHISIPKLSTNFARF